MRSSTKSAAGLAIGLFCLSLTPVQAQTVGIGTTSTEASAALDIRSPGNNQGVLVPRLTSGQRTGISNAVAGLLVYQTDSPAGFYYHDGSAWVSLSGGGGTTLPSQTGNAGKALTTDGSNLAYSGYPIVPMTKAARDAIASPAVGQTVYQTDDYPGLYAFVGKDVAGAANSTGWRCMSGDGPVTFYNYGATALTAAPARVTLDASQHTIYVTGNWNDSNFRPTFGLPDANTCKGRRYRFLVRNSTSTAPNAAATVARYGWNVGLVNSAGALIVTALGGAVAGAVAGDGRATEVFSDGVNWYESLTDLDINTQW